MTEVVGKVAVKVIPDTKGFRQRLKAALEKAERGLAVDIEVKLDDDGLRAQAKAVREKVDKSLKDIKIHVDLEDRSSIQRAISEVDRELSKLRQIEIPVGLNEADLKSMKDLLTESLSDSDDFKIGKRIQKQIQSQLDQLKINRVDLDEDALSDIEDLMTRIEETKLKITPELDPNQKRKVEHELEKLERQLKAKVEPNIEELALRHTQARLLILARDRIINLIPVVSKTAASRAAATLAALSGVRVVDKYLTRIKDSLIELDRNAPKLAGIKLALLNITAYALTAASNIFTASRSIVQIGQASVALPGILAGIAIGFGATIAVLKDFNQVLPEVGQKFHELQDQMSERFWRVAEEPIRNFINNLFPEFSAGLQSTSHSLGLFFARLSNSLSSELDGGVLGGMFDDLAQSIAISAAHTDSWARSIRILGEAGAGQLPRLAGWFGEVSDKFANFLTQAESDGRLQQWIETGIFQLQELGRVLRGLGSTAAGLARAAEAAGGSTLTSMADTLESVAKTVNSPSFQNALTTALTGAHEAMSNIAKNSGPAFKNLMHDVALSLGDILPIAGDALGIALRGIFEALDQPAVMMGAKLLIEGIRDAFIALEPALGPVGNAFGALMGVVGVFVEAIAPTLALVFANLANAIVVLAPIVGNLIQILGPALFNVVQALAPVFGALVDAVARIAVECQGPLEIFATQLAQLAEEVGPPLAEFIGKLGGHIAELLPPLLDLALVVLPPLTDILVVTLNVFNWLADAVNKVGDALPGTNGKLTAMKGVLSAIPGLGPGLSALFGGISHDTDSVNSSAATATSTLQGFGTTADGLTAGLSTLGTLQANPTITLVNGVSSTETLTAVQNQMALAGQAVANPTVNLIGGSQTTATIGGLQAGLIALNPLVAQPKVMLAGAPQVATDTASVRTAIGGLSQQVARPRVQVDPGTLNAARTAFSTTLPNAMRQGATGVTTQAQAMNRGAVNALSNLPNKFRSIGENAGNALAEGIESAIPAATAAADELVAQAERAANARAKIESPSKVWIGIGKYLGAGLVIGMEKSTTSVIGASSDLMGSAIDAVSTAKFFDTGQGAITSLVDGMESKYTSVTKSLDGLSSSMGSVDLSADVQKRVYTANANDLAATGTDGAGAGRTLIYNAAPTSDQLSDEEALFEAGNRARMLL